MFSSLTRVLIHNGHDRYNIAGHIKQCFGPRDPEADEGGYSRDCEEIFFFKHCILEISVLSGIPENLNKFLLLVVC